MSLNEDTRSKTMENNNKRSWLLVAAWFGTIVLIGLLKRGIDKKS